MDVRIVLTHIAKSLLVLPRGHELVMYPVLIPKI